MGATAPRFHYHTPQSGVQHLRCCPSPCSVTTSSGGHSPVLWSHTLPGDGTRGKTKLSTSLSPRLHFFGYEMSSLARSEVVRDPTTVNNVVSMPMDGDGAEVFQVKGKPPSRIRAYSHSINRFSLLNRIEGTQWDHSTCRWPSGVMSRPGLHMFLLLAGQALATRSPAGRSPCRHVEEVQDFHRCHYGRVMRGPTDGAPVYW